MAKMFSNTLHVNHTLIILASSLEQVGTILSAFRKTRLKKVAEWTFFPRKLMQNEKSADGSSVCSIL